MSANMDSFMLGCKYIYIKSDAYRYQGRMPVIYAHSSAPRKTAGAELRSIAYAWAQEINIPTASRADRNADILLALPVRKQWHFFRASAIFRFPPDGKCYPANSF